MHVSWSFGLMSLPGLWALSKVTRISMFKVYYTNPITTPAAPNNYSARIVLYCMLATCPMTLHLPYNRG